MRYFIGLGSNLGDRLANLTAAGERLRKHHGVTNLAAAPVFSTPALLPDNAPSNWNIPYLNSALALNWAGTPHELLILLKDIETALGRSPAARWAPRVIDLDILWRDGTPIQDVALKIPHCGLLQRSFVLDPLLHLVPQLMLPNGESVLAQARTLPNHAPLWMGILNITPDSFSDGGTLPDMAAVIERLACYEAHGVQILDIGAESTRPGAMSLTAENEWQRLEPVLMALRARYKEKLFRPLISVDTYRAETARQALALGANIINDVSGAADPAMLAVLRESDSAYVLMHSLSIPADKAQVLPAYCDPVLVLKQWFTEKLAWLEENGVVPSRVILDPGLGFGKTAAQSLALVQRCREFYDLPARLLIGHSRKSFMSLWSSCPASERDAFSIGASLQLAQQGVDILRVHAAEQHVQAWQAFQSCCAQRVG